MRISDWSSDVCSSDLLSSEAWLGAGGHAGLRRRRSRASLALIDCVVRRDLEAIAHNASRSGCHNSWRSNVCSVWTPPIPVSISRSEEHTSELQSLMRISYAVFFLKKKTI